MWILDQSESFIFRVDEIELGKIRNYYFIVFFQVGISDTSKYSTWKETNEKPIREGDYFRPIRELYFEIWIQVGIVQVRLYLDISN